MVNAKGHGSYQDTNISTASSVKLICMMYEGAIKFSRQAEIKIQAGDIPGKGIFISKASAIISELMNCLDMEKGGNIAENLARLYEFMNYQLIQANIKNDTKPIKVVISLLKILKEAWDELALQTSRNLIQKPVSTMATKSLTVQV